MLTLDAVDDAKPDMFGVDGAFHEIIKDIGEQQVGTRSRQRKFVS